MEPMAAELARLRTLVGLFRKRSDAFRELLECAANGGHVTAKEIMEIIRDYDLTLTKRGD